MTRGPVVPGSGPPGFRGSQEIPLRGNISALHSADEPAADPGPLPRLVQLAVDRLQGDWGEQVSTEAALTLRDLARFHPERLPGTQTALSARWSWRSPGLPVRPPAWSCRGRPAIRHRGAGTPPAPRDPDQLPEQRGRLPGRGRGRRRRRALFSLLDTEDDGSTDAVSVRAAATSLLGKIGSRPARLPAVVPRLYTGLLHARTRSGEPPSAAGRTWQASRSRFPRHCSTCCPPCSPTRTSRFPPCS